MALGGLIWGVALVAPPCFAFAGAWRLSRVLRAVTARPAERLLSQAATELGDEYIAISDMILPEGRVIHDVVLGPFGLAVFGDLPPARYVRRTGTSWEVRGYNGRWVHMENPLERVARDAERVPALVRRFGAGLRDEGVLGARDDRSDDQPNGRTCAVVTAEEISAWLTSLPPARQMTQERREEILERITALIVSW